MRLYLVRWSGVYEDEVCGVFSTREAANAAIIDTVSSSRWANEDDYSIEEWTLDEWHK